MFIKKINKQTDKHINQPTHLNNYDIFRECPYHDSTFLTFYTLQHEKSLIELSIITYTTN